jgi:hypothetical protein
MQPLKGIFSFFLFGTLSMSVIAQSQDTAVVKSKNNILKINLSSLLVKNISVQYERKVGKRISLAANVHYVPFGQLPFLSAIKKAIDDPSVPVDKLKWGGLGFTPELRFYIGKKGALRGFYFAPFANFTNYKTDLPLDYNSGSIIKTEFLTVMFQLLPEACYWVHNGDLVNQFIWIGGSSDQIMAVQKEI